MNYWLMKSEPSVFSIEDLQARPQQTACWDGVRNYQARNMMRDEMQPGDLAFFYHSSTTPPGIVGVIQITRAAYPDPTQFDVKSPYYDPAATRDKPRWMGVDVTFVRKLPQMITLEVLKQQPALQDMVLLRKGNRLSITPVTVAQWQAIEQLFS